MQYFCKTGITQEGSANYEYFICLDVLCGTISTLCLTAISIERTFAVKYPAMHHNLSRKPVLIAIAITWIVGLLLAAVKLTFGSHKIKSPYTLLILLMSFFVPLFVIIVSYIIIFLTAISVTQSANLTKEIRVAKTISVIIGLFVICWMPFFIANILYFYCDDLKSTNFCGRLHSSPWFVNVVISLRISNSMMNFFVYAVRSPIFRSTFQTLVFNLCGTTSMRAKVYRFSAYHNASKKTCSTKNISQREQKKDLGEKFFNNKNHAKSRDIAESIYLNSKDS